MDPVSKTNLVKSKSSNSAITTKSENRNKKTKSNAEFQPMLLKKRGVYVEKKSTRTQINEANKLNAQTTKIKVGPRPRPEKNKFLSSVLTLLSKSTAGTQCPDTTAINIETQKKDKRKRKTKKKTTELNQDENQMNKRKYRSKHLESLIKDVPRVRILQPQNDLINTPSNYSGKSNEVYRWSQLQLPPLVKKASEEEPANIPENHNVITPEDIVKEVLEGKKMRDKKQTEMERSVLDNSNKDKKLYNFFVDLLETTISVCDIEDKYNHSPSNASTSKVAFEIDEAVAKKLTIKNETPQTTANDEIRTVPYKNDVLTEKDFLNYLEIQSSFNRPAKSTVPRQIPMRTRKDFSGSYELAAPGKRHSLRNKKKSYRKSQKANLLKILKEELRMDDDAYNIEPQNLYQALKVIACNKRKCRKSIHFEDLQDTKTVDRDFRDNGCTLKRRALIPTKKQKKYRTRPVVEDLYKSFNKSYTKQFKSNKHKKGNNISKMVINNSDSNHSLEVYGYDYDSYKTDGTFSDRVNNEIYYSKYHYSPIRTKDEFSTSNSNFKPTCF